VRNYELDKTVSHTKLATGTVRRLSIAVVIDNKQEVDDTGALVSKPWTSDDLDRFTALVKDAVGFNATRGDTLNIINSSFMALPEVEAIPEPSLLEQPWVWDIAKQAVGGIGVLILIFGLLRPVMRSLTEKGAQSMAQANAMVTAAGYAGVADGDDQVSLSGGSPQRAQLEGPGKGYERHLETARSVVKEDPKRVAQVVKNWVNEDG
jgi:flagellar M-ring protein FliF